MRIRYRFIGFALTAVVAFAGPSMLKAGALSHLPANGELVQLEDDDWEILVNSGASISSPGSDTIVDTGDYLVGMLRISNLQQPVGSVVHDFVEPSGETFSAIFAVKATKLASGTDFVFSPLSDTEWGSIGLDGLGFARAHSGTVAIVFDDPDNIAPDTGGAKDGTVTDDLGTVGGTRLWEFGFDGDPFLFWAATSASDDVSTAGLGTFGTFNAALNVTHSYPAVSNLVVLDIAIGLLFPGAPGDAQLLINGSVFGSGDTDFDITSDSDLFMSVVPEPTSMVGFAIGLIGVGWLRRQRLTGKASKSGLIS